jgi:hypothetical protein
MQHIREPLRFITKDALIDYDTFYRKCLQYL